MIFSERIDNIIYKRDSLYAELEALEFDIRHQINDELVKAFPEHKVMADIAYDEWMQEASLLDLVKNIHVKIYSVDECYYQYDGKTFKYEWGKYLTLLSKLSDVNIPPIPLNDLNEFCIAFKNKHGVEVSVQLVNRDNFK